MRTDRRGFTLIEVSVALLILAVAILGLASVGTYFVKVTGASERQTVAIQLAEDRIERVGIDPDYPSLEARYAGSESSFPGLPGYERRTVVEHVGGLGQTHDYKKVTVTVTGPGLWSSVTRTLTVAAP